MVEQERLNKLYHQYREYPHDLYALTKLIAYIMDNEPTVRRFILNREETNAQ